MPDIPLKQKPYTNVESIGNTAAIESFIDCDKDDFMNNTFRHGLGGDTNDYFCNLGSHAKVDGLFYAVNKSIAIAVSDGAIYKIESDGTVTEITGVTLNSGIPVSFADYGNVGFFCNNSRIVKWTYADATCAYIADTDAPTNAIFVGFLDQYLIALRANSARFDYSDVADPDTWLGEFDTEETRPDNITALLTAFGEIFLPGQTTIAHWADSGDPTSPFQRIPGTTAERGTLSPYSCTQIDNSFYFLDSERRVIRMSGRVPSIISNPFDRSFQVLTDITDCIGYHFNAEGATKYVLTFPTDKKTYVYDYKLDFWSEWSYWDHRTGTREAYIGRVGRYIAEWDKYLVGSNTNGNIYIASRGYVTDNGDEIIAETVTGRIDWGTPNRKSSNRLRIMLERGTNAIGATNSPKVYFAKRDNGKQAWSAEKEIDLGEAGDTYAYKTFRRMGTYRNRQYRFRMQGAPTLINKATEDLTVIP